MATRWAKQYRKQAGEHGTWIIEETGLCEGEEASKIEADCTKRYVMEPLPQSRGAIMKVLDGTSPKTTKVKPTTYDEEYVCVKVHGQVDPYAPEQDFGSHDGHTILFYTIRYQQVGAIG